MTFPDEEFIENLPQDNELHLDEYNDDDPYCDKEHEEELKLAEYCKLYGVY